jgi:hypothetical protein
MFIKIDKGCVNINKVTFVEPDGICLNFYNENVFIGTRTFESKDKLDTFLIYLSKNQFKKINNFK